MEFTFHHSDIIDCVFLPFSRKMVLHSKTKSGFEQWRNCSKGDGIVDLNLLRHMNQCFAIVDPNFYIVYRSVLKHTKEY